MGVMERALHGMMYVSLTAKSHHDGQNHRSPDTCTSVTPSLSPHRFLKVDFKPIGVKKTGIAEEI